MPDALHRGATDRDAIVPSAPVEASAPMKLTFDTDQGSSRSKWIAGGLALALVAWMGSGYVLPSRDDTPEILAEAPVPPAVAVRDSVAREVTLFLSAEGQALPDRSSEVPSETMGEIAEVLVTKGQAVVAGEVIARIATAERASALTRATSDRERAQRDFDNAATLLERGVATADRVAETRSALAAAEATLAAAREAVAATEIAAPFAGRIETLDIDVGEYVQPGTRIATVVDNMPLTVAIRIPQQSLRTVRAGMPADVTFITGEERQGTVAFVGTSADAETRTFLAEVTVQNDDGAVPAGVSAKVRIPTGSRTAHLLSPAIMSLSSDGTLGIKTLGADNTVVFNEVEIVRAESAGVWLTGLPDTATVITVGQGFVSQGEAVTPRSEEDIAAEAAQLAESIVAGADTTVADAGDDG